MGNVGLVTKIYSDVTGAVERIKERLAEVEAPTKVTASRRRQALMNWESRKTDSSKEVPVDRKYADSIERRIRESRARQDQSEATNETEP